MHNLKEGEVVAIHKTKVSKSRKEDEAYNRVQSTYNTKCAAVSASSANMFKDVTLGDHAEEANLVGFQNVNPYLACRHCQKKYPIEGKDSQEGTDEGCEDGEEEEEKDEENRERFDEEDAKKRVTCPNCKQEGKLMTNFSATALIEMGPADEEALLTFFKSSVHHPTLEMDVQSCNTQAKAEVFLRGKVQGKRIFFDGDLVSMPEAKNKEFKAILLRTLN